MNNDYRPFLFADAYVLSSYTRDPTLVRLMQDDKVAFTSNLITKGVARYQLYEKNVKVPMELVRRAIEYYYVNNYLYAPNLVLSDDEILQTVADSYTQQIVDDFNQQHQNDKLDIWVTRYDGSHGLRQHSQIKLKEKAVSVPISFSNRY